MWLLYNSFTPFVKLLLRWFWQIWSSHVWTLTCVLPEWRHQPGHSWHAKVAWQTDYHTSSFYPRYFVAQRVVFLCFFLREFPWLVSAILGVMFFWFAKILMFNSQGISFRSWRKKHMYIYIFIIVGRFPEASLVGHGWFMLISADQRKTWVL